MSNPAIPRPRPSDPIDPPILRAVDRIESNRIDRSRARLRDHARAARTHADHRALP
jgi:hypothetical protein